MLVKSSGNFSSKAYVLFGVLKSQEIKNSDASLDMSGFFPTAISQEENMLLSWNF
jgi:hypothetical protein